MKGSGGSEGADGSSNAESQRDVQISWSRVPTIEVWMFVGHSIHLPFLC